MNPKYLVLTYNNNGTSPKYESYKTKKEIVRDFHIPLYIIDKLISMNNEYFEYFKDPKNRSKSHHVYRDVLQNVMILLIKPQR